MKTCGPTRVSRDQCGQTITVQAQSTPWPRSLMLSPGATVIRIMRGRWVGPTGGITNPVPTTKTLEPPVLIILKLTSTRFELLLS
jgi:hypothetical protein